MNAIVTSAAILTIVLSSAAIAQETTHSMGEHPAVIVKRAADKQGYDYAAKFYPHPAWLYLYSDSNGPALAEAREAAKAQAMRRQTERDEAATVGANIAASSAAAQRH